jgi:hypothetical protein
MTSIVAKRIWFAANPRPPHPGSRWCDLGRPRDKACKRVKSCPRAAAKMNSSEVMVAARFRSKISPEDTIKLMKNCA